ncbi:alpha-galactosidase [Lachnospiraceae bacterium C7]|nr:alpha-galactosidase [Lachnospiraceae bacterium C7]
MITFIEKDKLFTLETKNTTYQIKIDKYGKLLHLYYGAKVKGNMSYLLDYADRGFSGNIYEAKEKRNYSYDYLPQEMSSIGVGDFRTPGIVIKNQDGSISSDFRFEKFKIKKGKYSLDGLPASYAQSNEADTLEITTIDKELGLELKLFYGIFYEKDIITRATQIINFGNNKVEVLKADSANLDFLNGNFEMLTFHGRHAFERQLQRQAVKHGIYQIGSSRGTSSHQYNPLIFLIESDTNEKRGNCYGFELEWSGSFHGIVEKSQYNQTRVSIGAMSETFDYKLGKSEILTMPEVMLSFSSNGIGQVSRNFHDIIRENICRLPKEKMKVTRPILVNSWEAAYFDISGEKLLELADSAKELGIEMLVMDDGWFGQRNDDNQGLGDWYVNEKKLGMTLADLSKKIKERDMKFGIWIEPEMVNENSIFYRKHPDYVLKIPSKAPICGRNQLVLDFSRKEVVDEIFTDICKVLDQGNVDYIKWDCNRSLTDIFSNDTYIQENGQTEYKYVLGVYDFLERLRKRYPNILIEGCSGGGGRFDAGMLYYTPQIWCSDNTDAIDRLQIQYGTSFGYPLSAIGSHVSVSPNEQCKRETTIETRGTVAMAGTFGYEMNVGKLNTEEKLKVRQQIKEYKDVEPLILQGDYYRLSNIYDDTLKNNSQRDGFSAWEVVSKDKKNVLLSVVVTEIHGNMIPNYIFLDGLDPNATYADEKTGEKYNGATLMHAGFLLPTEYGQYNSYMYKFTVIE